MSMRDVFDISAYLVLGPENTLGRPVADIAGQAISAGFTCVQVRSKECSARELIACTAAVADEIARLGATDRVALLVDDRLDVVYAARQHGVKVDGVHVGQSDESCASARARLGEGAIVGVSAQPVEQALAAQAAGADYLGVGALFKTATKPEAADVSLRTLREICAAVSIPVVGIGGLNASTLASLAHTGVHGAAVVSAIFAAGDIVSATQDLRRIMDGVDLLM